MPAKKKLPDLVIASNKVLSETRVRVKNMNKQIKKIKKSAKNDSSVNEACDLMNDTVAGLNEIMEHIELLKKSIENHENQIRYLMQSGQHKFSVAGGDLLSIDPDNAALYTGA